MNRNNCWLPLLVKLAVAMAVIPCLQAAGLPSFGFAAAQSTLGWLPTHDISSLTGTAAGLKITISGHDPYSMGPARNYPTNTLLWLQMRLYSEVGGVAQVFYYQDFPTESKSLRFAVPSKSWYEVKIPMPSLGPQYRLRFDPPATTGICLVESLWFEERFVAQAPVWPVPTVPELGNDALTITAGPLQIIQGTTQWGHFQVRVEDQLMAVGHNHSLMGYLSGSTTRWLALNEEAGEFDARLDNPTQMVVTRKLTDPDGSQWIFKREFKVIKPGVIQANLEVSTSLERQVVYLPAIQLVAGLGSFGTNKHQGIFAGLEYLENEPSSSEADLRGPASKRLVPDTSKITIPLMAIQAEGRYVGISWQPQANLCALFDSPDRVYKSAGHLMGLLLPGSTGNNREADSLLPYDSLRVPAGESIKIVVCIYGNLGQSVVSAIQEYVHLNGLPDLPAPGLTRQEYFETAARGWLDSEIRQTNQFRHAVWPGFNPVPAADAAFWMDWLSVQLLDAALTSRLISVAREARNAVKPEQWNQARVGHVHYPAPALVYGAVAENAEVSKTAAASLLSRFEGEGVVLYHPPAQGIDYSATHWSKEANGYTATVLASLLEQATFSGDALVVSNALRHLRALHKFRQTVPRGAQTWEIPLHTPDILASAYLAKAYRIGYELTRDPDLLDEAIYWAWTGVPFVYLVPPTTNAVGLYATIPVLGATGWEAPVWIGLPVQWCGLVYAESLWSLAAYDPQGPWLQIAKGISASGIQQTWRTNDLARQGLLPDSYSLKEQLRDGPAINPATVLSQAVRFFADSPVYEAVHLPEYGLRIFVSGRISELQKTVHHLRFHVAGWRPFSHWLYLNGVKTIPQVYINQTEVEITAPHQYWPLQQRLILNVPQSAQIEIRYPARMSLSISPKVPPSVVEVRWFVLDLPFELEVSSDISKDALWQRVTNAFLPGQGVWLETNGPVQRFYRLKSITIP